MLPLLALLATAPAVAAFHASRGVPADVSAATLADLGQQTRVHRLVHGGFGLGTHAWEAGYVWSGALYRLGRLQFDLERQATVDGTGEEWVLSTHIPRGERLVPEEVDASLAAALPFFAEHFGEHPAADVHCRSWMLDARIPDLLPGSNLAWFQQRWRTYGMPGLGDEDALFFAFARPPTTDLQAVPAETSLQRAIASVWRSGNHWLVVDGRLGAVTAGPTGTGAEVDVLPTLLPGFSGTDAAGLGPAAPAGGARRRVPLRPEHREPRPARRAERRDPRGQPARRHRPRRGGRGRHAALRRRRLALPRQRGPRADGRRRPDRGGRAPTSGGRCGVRAARSPSRRTSTSTTTPTTR